jgi:hypothetical protein
MSENLLPLENPHVYIFDMRKSISFWERGVFKGFFIKMQGNSRVRNVLTYVI